MNENEQAAVAVLLAKTPAFIQLRWENGSRRIYFAVKGHFQAQLAIKEGVQLLKITEYFEDLELGASMTDTSTLWPQASHCNSWRHMRSTQYPSNMDLGLK